MLEVVKWLYICSYIIMILFTLDLDGVAPLITYPPPGLHKIENWPGPHKNWLQSAFSNCVKKAALKRISTYLFIYYIYIFLNL